MIKTNEVRRGNLIQYNPGDVKRKPTGFGYLTVDQIKEHALTVDNSKDGLSFTMFPSDLEGVPLTAEMIKALGFTYREYLDDYFIKIGSGLGIVLIRPRVGVTKIVPENAGSVGISHCQYLHQLQNLYFVLNGEELNIKSLLK
jgi:hypothetical protein